MHRFATNRWLLLTFVVFVLVDGTLIAARLDAAPPTGTPAPATRAPTQPSVMQLVERQTAKIRGYRTGDLIIASDVEPVLKELEARSGRRAEIDRIRQRLVPDNSTLAKQLRTPAGQAFMRDASRYGHGYDRIDQLSRLPDGPQLLARLIQGPDGYKLIEYMSKSTGGRELERQLSRSPGGQDFTTDTGRIYTAEQLVGELEAATRPAPPQRGRSTPNSASRP